MQHIVSINVLYAFNAYAKIRLNILEHTIYGRQLTKGNMKMVSINLANIYWHTLTLGEIYRFFYLRKLGSCFAVYV